MLVGAEHFADAGVYRVRPDLALVQTTDFFSPIVDDPADFGRVAAANALSDVYAMGGAPATAMNLVLFPDQELPLEVLEAILHGAAVTIQAAGASIVGGHSVRSAEIVFGLALTGLVDPARMLTNAAAQPGQAIVLTKGLGSGIAATANRAERCPEPVMAAALNTMMALNDVAAAGAVELGATAATDITGFGLAVHASEVARASNVRLHLHAAALPRIPGIDALATPEQRSRASGTNRGASEGLVHLDDDVGAVSQELIFDPQTSGGLLVCLPDDAAETLVTRCRDAGHEAAVVGDVQAAGDGGPSVTIAAGR